MKSKLLGEVEKLAEAGKTGNLNIVLDSSRMSKKKAQIISLLNKSIITYKDAYENKLHEIAEASPISYILFDKNITPVDCNSAALKLYACPDKKYFLENYWEAFSPMYQPDGRRSFEKANAIKDRVFTEGKIVIEWDYKTLDGETIPTEITMSNILLNNEKYLVSYNNDLRSMKKMEENIKWLETEAEKVYYDALTGIYNRRYFDENLNRVIKSLSRSDGTLSLMMIDIDFFKNYNDTYGHSKGDDCLKAVAETLSKSIERSEDFVARYGGEEFSVVLPNTYEKGARIIAEKLLENTRELNIKHEKSKAAKYITVSIGVSTGKVEHSQTADDYIKHADAMLYKSKQSGRNKYTFDILKKADDTAHGSQNESK